MRLPARLRLALKRLAIGGIGASPDGRRVVERLALRPGMRVADIGAGFGDFAWRFADAVGPSGRVYAVDVDLELNAEVTRAAVELGRPQVVAIAAADDDPHLPEPVDLVFLSSSFHHLPDPGAWFRRLGPHLAAGALVVILEPRRTLLTGWFGHASDPDVVVATLEAAGFRRVWRDDVVRHASFQAFGAGEAGRGRTGTGARAD